MNKQIQAIITNALLAPLFFVLSFLISKNKNLFLLGSGLGEKFIGNPKYFYLWLNKYKNNNRAKYYWLTNNKKIYKELLAKGLPVVMALSVKGLWYLFRASVLIVEQSSQDVSPKALLFGRFTVINTWHGTPIKNISVSKVFTEKSIQHFLKRIIFRLEQKNYNVILASSFESKRKLMEGLENNNVKVLGYPRDDVLFDKDLLFHNWEKYLEISRYKKIFLYAPTFRDNLSLLNPFSDKFLKKLDDYLIRNKILLLIKTHPLSGDKIVASGYRNIRNITEEIDDIQEILVFTDLLIADYSSLIFDFILTDKPVIFYPYDYYDYVKNSREMYYDYFSEMIGPFGKNEEDLLSLIKNSEKWSKEKEYRSKYRLFKDKFFKYKDGNSSKRLYSLLMSESS